MRVEKASAEYARALEGLVKGKFQLEDGTFMRTV
jgi:hypothetical protein